MVHSAFVELGLLPAEHMHTVATTTTTNTTGVESNPSWHMLSSPTNMHTHTSLEQPTAFNFKRPVLSHLQCTCACPPRQSSQSVRCRESTSHFSPVSPSLCFFHPSTLNLPVSPSLSLSLPVSRSPVAHAAETLYLIHYNTSRLTPSQMGGWLLLVLAN